MQRLIDLTGRRFGRLTVVSRAENTKSGAVRWLCKCECGNTTVSMGQNLKKGKAQSCGCLAKEISSINNRTHGLRGTRLYKIWQGMKQRCHCPSSVHYERYGSRGITVCDEWRNDFKSFYDWAMANGYSDDLSIDRIDNDKGYFPENCRWASNKDQQSNLRSNRLLTLNGETHTLSEWASIKGVSKATICSRLKRGWSIEKAIIKN